MNKEPIALYIFRFILGLGLFAFMCMLYWSSNLIEQDMKGIQKTLSTIEDEIAALKTEVKTRQFSPTVSTDGSKKEESKSTSRPHIDPSYPNLLQDDPFYSKTLPMLLGPDFLPHGTRHMASIGRPKNLHPFSNWAEVSTWISSCSVSVSALQFGKFETMSPDMAIKVEARPLANGVPEFWVHLRDQVYWQPLNADLFEQRVILAPHFLEKHQVTAHDFKFNFDAIMNPFVQEDGALAMRNMLEDIEEINVIDDLTFVVRWKTHMVKQAYGQEVPKIKYGAKLLTGSLSPLASFVYKYFPDGTKIIEDDKDPETYRKNSVWAQNFSQHWAKNIIPSCGPWIFSGMTERQISFKRNPNYYFNNAALIEEQENAFKETPDAVWQDFKSGKLDSYTLRPDQLVEWENFQKSPDYAKQVAAKQAIKRLDFLFRGYSYIGWNMVKPYFTSRKVRQAMTMAIDRKTIIQSILNGMGVMLSGPFPVQSSAYDSSIAPWPFDPDQSRRLLEEEGWFDSDNDGIREKMIDGKKVIFSFSLTYYIKNPTSEAICAYVATALKDIGINCKLNGVDLADLSATLDDKSFDAVTLGWTFAPPPYDPRQIWSSEGAKEKGSSNTIGFANAEADEIMNRLLFEDNSEKRTQLYHRLHAIIHEEAPYTFLYIPKNILLYREYLQNVFIPADRQDLIPGADMEEPQPSIFWIKRENS